MAFIAIKYELLSLEELIRDDLAIDNVTLPLTAIRVKKWKSFVEDECRRIRKGIVHQVLSLSKTRHVELYIQQHQSAMIMLSDLLFHYEAGVGEQQHKSLKNLYKEINLCIVDLLDYLLHYFEPFFDVQHAIPLLLKQKVSVEFSEYQNAFSNVSIKDDTVLLDLMLEPVRAIATEQLANLNFYQLDYFRKYTIALKAHCEKQNDKRSFLQLLMQLNFNDETVIRYCTWYLTKELQEEDDRKEQVQFLASYTKELKQMLHLERVAYKPDKISVIGYCIQWIAEEYQYIQGNVLLDLSKDKEKAPEVEWKQKITTMLSVTELGVFLQLLKRQGIIQCKNQTEMIEFFASSFITKNKEAISAKNLRNCYYNLESKAVADIKDTLYALLKTARELD